VSKYQIDVSPRRWRRYVFMIIMLIVIILIGLVYLIRRVYDENLKPVSASQHKILVSIPSGSTAHDIGLRLQKDGVIRADWAFEWYVRTNNLRDKLEAGSYYLAPNQSTQDIADVVTQGKVAIDLVTILPGQRIDQIRSTLINKYSFKAEDVDKALDPVNYKDHPALVDKPLTATLEGYLYPDSYQRTATTSPQTIIKASLDEMQKHLTPELRTAIEHQGLTVYQGVTLASIIEQEVSNPSDKPIVAQVFLRRLQQGMPLGSDVTAYYGSLVAGQTPSLTYDSSYNTLLHVGYPPGPISNVSDSSLQAVAHPASTDYVYFVAGDDGVTYFSHTLQEHQQLIQKHCQKLCSQ